MSLIVNSGVSASRFPATAVLSFWSPCERDHRFSKTKQFDRRPQIAQNRGPHTPHPTGNYPMLTTRRALTSLALLTTAFTIVASIAFAQTDAEKAAPATEKAAPATEKAQPAADTSKKGNPQIPRTG